MVTKYNFCVLRLTFKDKSDYEDSGTKTFDRMAFRYLGMAFFPLAICYCIYSAIYNEHKGWYSFVLSSTYGFLLTFGKYYGNTGCGVFKSGIQNKNYDHFSSSRLYHDDPSIVYQLQIEICGSFTLAYDDLQGNTFSNFSCRFLNSNNFFQFEL